MKNLKSPCGLVILDGFGYRKNTMGNAIKNANMPFWDYLTNSYFNTHLKASGKAVGLPNDFMGNSEVGHLTLGSGRITESILSRFNKIIDNGEFFKNEIIKQHFIKLHHSGKSLHIMGLLSNAGVHSHTKHLYAFLDFAKQSKLEKVYIHAFLDGRDTQKYEAAKYLSNLECFIKENHRGVLASIQGRYFAMDRDSNWDRIKKSYNVLTNPNLLSKKDWREILGEEYARGNSDEFVEPTRIIEDGFINDGDGIVFFNFRADRARELSECFLNPNFDKFVVDYKMPKTSFFISTIRYNDIFKIYNNDVLFIEPSISNTLLDVLASYDKKVFIIAETEKYAHVSYFFRGERDIQTSNETRILIPSIKARDYINNPQMSAPLITEKIVKNLNNETSEFYLVNYANADMVGHSGNFQATIKACECLDEQLKVLYKEFIQNRSGTMFIVADHGNAEEMIDPNGEILGMHSTNTVPFLFISSDEKTLSYEIRGVGLSNVAPTILNFLGLSIPSEMEKELIINF